MYDTIILGGGPAGVAAGIYATRKKIKTLLITQEFGGQSVVSDNIENWIGTPSITGIELAKNLESHLRAQKGIEIKSPEKVLAVQNNSKEIFTVVTDKNSYQTKTVIVTLGGRHRRLDVPGGQEFEGKGIAYCSTCDAPIFANKSVAVVGGGNAGLEAVQDLIPYAKEIYLLTNIDSLNGDPVTIEAIKKSDKLKKIIYNVEITQIKGNNFVQQLKYNDKPSKKSYVLDVQGVFVEIGSVPNSEVVKSLVDLNKGGQIIIDHRLGTTSHPAIFAAGDVTDVAYQQNNISVGDGVKAALSAYNYLLKRK